MQAEELVQTITTDVGAAQRNLQAASDVFTNTVVELLYNDDRLLARIGRLAGELEFPSFDGGQQITRPRMLCKRLSTYLADEIRCRLECIYLEMTRFSTKSRGRSSGDETELETELEAELDTLYSEITAVAQMSTNLEFENPLTEVTRQESVQRHVRATLVLDHVRYL